MSENTEQGYEEFKKRVGKPDIGFKVGFEESPGYGVSYLDDRDCFYLWAELGSLGKASQELARRGQVNPKTGKPPTRMSVSVAARRWLSENLEEGYQVYLKCGSLMSWEDFLKWSVGYIRTVKSRTEYRRWLKKNNLTQYDIEYSKSYETLEDVENDDEIQEIRKLYEKLKKAKGKDTPAV